MLSGMYAKVRAIVASDKFFYAVVALLVLQASWIALTGRFPMAYDEQNHLGIVKLYAEHISPFWGEPPAGDAPYSSVSRDPSYLYHWLMSFPYRLFDLFLKNDESKVIAFRFISVALFAAGLVLYRKLLLRTTAGKAAVHAALALFVLIPTVPFLAGQMNYDNLLFVLVAGLLLLTTRIVEDMRQKRLDSRKLALFVAGGMLAGLVKFPFLPLLLAMGVWILAAYFRRFGRKGWRAAGTSLAKSFRPLSRGLKIAMVAGVLLAGTLFFERYGLNTIRYSTPVPECDQVLSVERCKAFGPWKRNYDIYQAKLAGTLEPKPPSLSFSYFAVDEWFNLIIWQFFYTLNGPAGKFEVGFPYPVPYHTGTGLLLAGTLLSIAFWRRLARRPHLLGLLGVSLFYVLVLLLQNYADFLRMHLATAIQARYIVLVLPVLLLTIILGYGAALRRLPAAKPVLLGAMLLILLTQGGGIGVYIMRSNPLWWRENRTVVRVSQTAQKILWPLPFGDDVKAPKSNY